jgi:peptidoglycan/LPS O-acetylase OafA/YrhL
MALSWSPFPHATAFVLGIWIFRLRSGSSPSSLQGDLAAVAVVLAVVIHIFEPRLFSVVLGQTLFVSILTAALLLYGSSRSRLIRAVFENGPILWLGLFSYALYLIHFPLLAFLSSQQIYSTSNEFLQLVAVLACSSLLALIAYVAVETPGISAGRKLAALLYPKK